MTVFANVGRLNVRLVLASCRGAIVAVHTISRYRGMIESCRQPASGRMAIVTGITAGNMRRLFTDGNNAVVTGAAGTDDLRVVDCHHGREYVGGVTVLADVR